MDSKDINFVEVLRKGVTLWEVEEFGREGVCLEKAEIRDVNEEPEEKLDVGWEIKGQQRHMHYELQGINHAPEKLQTCRSIKRDKHWYLVYKNALEAIVA